MGSLQFVGTATTWQRHLLPKGDETLVVEALPAVHARGRMRALLPPVMGRLLTQDRDGVVGRFHVRGDTLIGDHLRQIHERHPDFDVYRACRSRLSDVVDELDRAGPSTRLLLPERAETVPLGVLS
jgi:hypothetical protein